MKAYQKGLVALLAVSALAFSACSGGDKAKSGGDEKSTNNAMQADWNPQPRDNVKDGGELRLPISEIPAQKNVLQGNSLAVTNQIWRWYNMSLQYSDSPAGELEFDKNYVLSAKDELKNGKTVVTYVIEPKAKFNDGTPLDVDTFIGEWNACGKGNKAYQCAVNDGYILIEDIKAGKDKKEVVVTYKQAYPWWKTLFNGLHPKATATPEAFEKAYLDKEFKPEWGIGPFKLADANQSQGTLTFVRNEKWWGDTPKLEKVTLRVMDMNASMQAFKNGEIDVKEILSADQLAQVKNVTGVEIRKGVKNSFRLMSVNSETEAMKDIKVREALFRSIDRKQWASVVFQGLDWTEEAPGSFIAFPFQKGYNDNLGEVFKYDPAKAEALLQEAGYKKNGEYYEKNGKVLELRVPVFGEGTTMKTRARTTEAMAKKVGIKLKLEQKTENDFSKVSDKRDYDVILMGFQMGAQGVPYMCQTYCSDSTLNKSHTTGPDFDKKIEEMLKLPTKDEQIKRANQLEVEAFKTFGIMPFANGPDITAVRKGLANMGASVFAFKPTQDLGWNK